MKNNMLKSFFQKSVKLAGISAALLLLAGCGESGDKSVQLDPDNPTQITIWHYYNGSQQAAFDRLVEEFNRTEGKELGIYVTADSQGNVSDLESSVLAAFNKEVGSSEPPDIFSSYADTAYSIDKMDMLVDLDEYMTQEELDTYVDSFVEEGRIGANGELRIFPTAKSSEIFMMSKTDWEPFAAATGASLEDLATMEGVAATAEAYYEWTDAQTPDIPGDGKAFYGRDAMANLFLVGSMQLGTELFKVENGTVTIQADENVMRRIWDTYYVPYVKGYFSSYGRFRSDDVKIGEIIAYTGSTSSANYFPDEIETADGTKQIDYIILPAPVFEGGTPYAVQQGAGMVVTKSTPEREYAAVTFLKWFTSEENNLLFGCTSGYMPVKKSALSTEMLDKTIADNALQVPGKTYETLVSCFDTAQTTTLYTNKAFDHGADARNVLEYHLADKAAADRELVLERIGQGAAPEDACADLICDQAFEEWYASFVAALNEAAAQ